MKSSCVALALLLALNMASCRLSLAATDDAHDDDEGASIPAILGRDLRGFIARAGSIFRPAGAAAAGGGALRSANVTAGGEAKNLRAVASRRRRRPARKSSGGGGAGCVSAAACRKRRVICAKRCYGASASRAATVVNHVPSRCVVRCKKCVPTC